VTEEESRNDKSETNKSETNEPNKTIIGIVIAIIGLLGSLGGAWITTGAKFDRELEKKESEVSALSASIDKLKSELQQTAELRAKVQTLSGSVDGFRGDLRRVQADVATFSASVDSLRRDLRQVSDSVHLEDRIGFLGSANGIKACKITVSGRWIDVVTLPRSATGRQCEDESRNQAAGSAPAYYALGCIFSDRLVWAGNVPAGVGASPPSPNCGW
jgi:uncharacterized protein YoxC